jgi:uncharacterized protein YbcI
VHGAGGGDTALIGAAQQDQDGGGNPTLIRIVTDADAVYAVDDPYQRAKGDRLGVTGRTGGQGVADDSRDHLLVVLDSDAASQTLVRIAAGCHHSIATDESTRLSGGELNAAIARSVVRYHNEHLGRGPTRARAFYRDNVIVVLLEDAMTKAERSLAASGKSDAVRDIRAAIQDAMRAALVATVETLTGCKVDAIMSTTHLDPDMAAEVFVLDRPVPGS